CPHRPSAMVDRTLPVSKSKTRPTRAPLLASSAINSLSSNKGLCRPTEAFQLWLTRPNRASATFARLGSSSLESGCPQRTFEKTLVKRPTTITVDDFMTSLPCIEPFSHVSDQRPSEKLADPCRDEGEDHLSLGARHVNSLPSPDCGLAHR